MKKLYFNRFISLLLCLFLSFSASFVPVRRVDASALPSIRALVNYVLTIMGAVSVTDNVVGKVTGDSIITRLSDAITACLGDGSIYISADGDYVFNSDSTQAIYEAFLDDSSIDAKVISSFPQWDSVIDNSYVNQEFYSKVDEYKLKFSSFLLQFNQYYNSRGSEWLTFIRVYDISNVSCISCLNDYDVKFVGSDGNYVTCDFWEDKCWMSSNGTISMNSARNEIHSSAQGVSNFVATSLVTFDDFPVIAYNDYLYCFYANHSVVISKNISAGNSLSDQNSGVVYNNYYDIFPSVSSTVLEENNWENIYNSYVTTVNNDYQSIYNENGGVSSDELRSILKSVGDTIGDIIENAGGEIVENLDDILTWLSRIYDRLGLIENGLSQVTDNQSEVASVISDMKDIVDSYSSDLSRLQQIYVVLGQILNAIPSGGGGGGINIDIVTDVPDLLDDDVLDLIDKGDVLESALESVVPFCFIPFFGVLINAFAVTPTDAPSFVMPLKLSNTFVDIDLEEEISLDWFDSVHDAYVAGWCLLLIITLMFLTFKLFYFINSMI